MAGQTVILDSSNLEAVIADATGEKPPEAPQIEAKGAEVEKVEEVDVEGEDGLTPSQKKDLTQKMQSAIGKKHRELKEAEEFAAEQYNERRLAEHRAEGFAKELERLKQQNKPPEEVKEPKRENFKTEEEYQDARVDYRAEMKFQEKEAQLAQARQAQIIEAAKASIARAMDLVPDFKEKTDNADYIVPPHVADLMQRSEVFAELGYHFAEHPEDLAKLAIANPSRLMVEFRKIESNLKPFGSADGPAELKVKANGAKQPTPPSTETENVPRGTETPSKPRAPIKPLSSGSAVQVEKPASERTYEEERAAWQKKHGVRFDRRQRH